MPPRYSYWTILAGGLPTSFRAALREDLLPTLRRLQQRHPDAVMKWFARGRIWSSPEEASVRGRTRPAAEGRDPSWRPGGTHQDPRGKYQAAKRVRNLARRQKRFERRQSGSPSSEGAERPATDKARVNRASRGRTNEPWRRTNRSAAGTAGATSGGSSRRTKRGRGK